MEIVKGIHDLIIVLGFVGIAIIPRAILTYLAIRQDKATDQAGSAGIFSFISSLPVFIYLPTGMSP
jgi:hypothetical protein